jgi:ketosteroid isomerase-like protein
VNGKEKVEAVEFSGVSIRVYGSTATARVQITLRTTTDGQTTTMILATLHVWVKNPSGWQLVARQATRLNP